MRALTVDVYCRATDLRKAFATDVRGGLTAPQKAIPPTWFYDEHGCALYDAITQLPEYYPTRTERQILERRAGEIARHAPCDTLVEIGAGTSEKTRILIDALLDNAGLATFVPFDVSEPTLRMAGEKLLYEYPGLSVHAVVGDFHHHLRRLPTGGRRLVAFLGSTIGNLLPDQRARFLADIAATMQPGDQLLLGVDLVKDPARLVDAYDDPAGVTAAFNRNLLVRINRELGADFEPNAFEHIARWDAEHSWIEMRLRAQGPQRVHIDALDLEVDFADGEDLLTEISTKFTLDGIAGELAAASLIIESHWTDRANDFLLTLSTHPHP